MFDSSVARPVAGRLIPRGDFEALGLLRADGKYGIISSISRKAGSSGCGGKSSRGWREAILVTFSFQSMGKVLSIFVDESGRFQFPDADSRFYILGLVLHDQSQPIDRYVADLQRAEDEIGLEGHCFHAGPLIRKEKGYEFMSRKWRGRILSRMMAFAQKVPFKYHCLDVDKKLIDNLGQIVERLRRQLVDFISEHRVDLFDVETVKVYYDCGQSPVTNLLHKTFEEELGKRVEFAQGVHPANYRLFQLADLVCSLHLIERRLAEGDQMTTSEMRLFGGPRDFKRNILKKIKTKEI